MAKLCRKEFEKALKKLHVELVKLQEWVKQKDLKIVIIFVGRDAAGKGAVIKRLTAVRSLSSTEVGTTTHWSSASSRRGTSSRDVPETEQAIVHSGITLVKYWFEVSQAEQTRRFMARINDWAQNLEATSYGPRVTSVPVRLLSRAGRDDRRN